MESRKNFEVTMV